MSLAFQCFLHLSRPSQTRFMQTNQDYWNHIHFCAGFTSKASIQRGLLFWPLNSTPFSGWSAEIHHNIRGFNTPLYSSGQLDMLNQPRLQLLTLHHHLTLVLLHYFPIRCFPMSFPISATLLWGIRWPAESFLALLGLRNPCLPHSINTISM